MTVSANVVDAASATNWNFQSLIALAAVVATVVTFVATRRQELRLKRAELVRTYTTDLYATSSVLALFTDIDHNRFVYTNALIDTDREVALIQLLDHFNSIGHNVHEKVLSLADIMPTTMAYAILRTWEDKGVRTYLEQIRTWDEERFIPGYGFRYFELLAIRIHNLRDTLPQWRVGHHDPFSAPARPPMRIRALIGHPRLARLLVRLTAKRIPQPTVRGDLAGPQGNNESRPAGMP